MTEIEKAQFMQEFWLVFLVTTCSLHKEENNVSLVILKWHVCIDITLLLSCCNALKLLAPLIYEVDIIIRCHCHVNVLIFPVMEKQWNKVVHNWV